jgi:hypothetical protein
MIFVGFTQKTHRTAHDAKTASDIPDCDRFAAERLDLCHGPQLHVAVVNVDRNLSVHTSACITAFPGYRRIVVMTVSGTGCRS